MLGKYHQRLNSKQVVICWLLASRSRGSAYLLNLCRPCTTHYDLQAFYENVSDIRMLHVPDKRYNGSLLPLSFISHMFACPDSGGRGRIGSKSQPFLKYLLHISNQISFVLTGSSLATFWLNIAMLALNGTSANVLPARLDLPRSSSTSGLDYMWSVAKAANPSFPT